MLGMGIPDSMARICKPNRCLSQPGNLQRWLINLNLFKDEKQVYILSFLSFSKLISCCKARLNILIHILKYPVSRVNFRNCSTIVWLSLPLLKGLLMRVHHLKLRNIVHTISL